MVESFVDDLPGGVLYKEPEDVLEAFVKDYFPNMNTKTRGATLIGVRESPTKREVTLAMHMLGLYFHSDMCLYDMWAKVRMEGVDLYLRQQASCCWSLCGKNTNECRALQELDEGYYQKALLDQLVGNIWADPQRSHDPLVLNWVATALDFDKLITCWCTSGQDDQCHW